MIDSSVYINEIDRVAIAESARIDRWVKIEGSVAVGEHVHIASFCHIGAGGGTVEIGNHSTCSSHVVICSGMPDLAYLHISAADPPEHQHPKRMRTVIGEHVVIFAGAVICPGVTIGNGAVIGAGAVVTKDVPAMTVVSGVPAQRVRKRNLREMVALEMRPHEGVV